MSEAEHVIEAKRWLRYAQEDLQTANLILAHQTIAYRHICWLSQQCVEKAIKAALIYLQIEFRRTHDLDLLLNMLPNGWRAKEVAPDLADMTEWAVESRYPGDWPEASEYDARSAVIRADQILTAIKADLLQTGLR